MNNVAFVLSELLSGDSSNELDQILSEKEDQKYERNTYIELLDEHYRLKALYEASEKKINSIKKDIFQKMKEVNKQKIKGNHGYSYTIATRKAKVVSDVDVAFKTIEAYGMQKDLFLSFNDEKYIACFPQSEAITEKVTSEYLVIKKNTGE